MAATPADARSLRIVTLVIAAAAVLPAGCSVSAPYGLTEKEIEIVRGET